MPLYLQTCAAELLKTVCKIKKKNTARKHMNTLPVNDWMTTDFYRFFRYSPYVFLFHGNFLASGLSKGTLGWEALYVPSRLPHWHSGSADCNGMGLVGSKFQQEALSAEEVIVNWIIIRYLNK